LGGLVQPVKIFVIVIETCLSKIVARMLRREDQTASFFIQSDFDGIQFMRKNTPPPDCPNCKKPMKFVLVKTGDRKFRCLDCQGQDLSQSPDVLSLPTGSQAHAASVRSS
jgi:hypothetical protein